MVRVKKLIVRLKQNPGAYANAWPIIGLVIVVYALINMIFPHLAW